MLRLAYGRFFHEANVHSPLPTTDANFARFQDVAGESLAERVRPTRWELPGLLPYAELSGFCAAARHHGGAVELVPLRSAFAVPSGKLARASYDAILADFLARLEAAGPLDGVYVALHGSMRVEGMRGSPEAHFLGALRAALPARTRLAASFDLHGNLTPGAVEALDVLQAFRANPHWDLFPTGWRAGRTLLRTLRGRVRPTSAWRKLPIVLGGGIGIDLLPPARSVFRLMKRMHRREPALLNASFFMVHPFSDADDLGWAVHVTTDDDPRLAERLAERLADAAWAIREVPIPEPLPLAEALAKVRRRAPWHRPLPSSLVDMGDGVLTGSSGGSTALLRQLLANPPGLRVYVPLHDPSLVCALWGRVGERVEAVAQGTAGLTQEPVPLHGRVSGRATLAGVRAVHLDLGEVQLACTEEPPLSAHPRFWRELGLPPRAADAIVQKSFFQYRLLYLGTSHQHIPVASPGPSDLWQVTRRRFPTPVYPQDAPADWRAGDRALRGLSARS